MNEYSQSMMQGIGTYVKLYEMWLRSMDKISRKQFDLMRDSRQMLDRVQQHRLLKPRVARGELYVVDPHPVFVVDEADDLAGVVILPDPEFIQMIGIQCRMEVHVLPAWLKPVPVSCACSVGPKQETTDGVVVLGMIV